MQLRPVMDTIMTATGCAWSSPGDLVLVPAAVEAVVGVEVPVVMTGVDMVVGEEAVVVAAVNVALEVVIMEAVAAEDVEIDLERNVPSTVSW